MAFVRIASLFMTPRKAMHCNIQATVAYICDFWRFVTHLQTVIRFFLSTAMLLEKPFLDCAPIAIADCMKLCSIPLDPSLTPQTHTQPHSGMRHMQAKTVDMKTPFSAIIKCCLTEAFSLRAVKERHWWRPSAPLLYTDLIMISASTGSAKSF